MTVQFSGNWEWYLEKEEEHSEVGSRWGMEDQPDAFGPHLPSALANVCHGKGCVELWSNGIWRVAYSPVFNLIV